ncbi:MAG: glycosyl transferase family 2, partial [Thermoplasmata archaeon]|nr:glycosyl transferase family 2 [Thermoplasmata archaeon]
MGADGKLSPDLVKKCKKIKPIDILVGVISKDVESTILHVLNVVNEGLYSYFPDYRKAIAVSVGQSTDRTFELAELFQPYNSIEKIVTEDVGGKGKGAGIGTILKIAELMDAKSVVLVDGDLLSIRPKWIESI